MKSFVLLILFLSIGPSVGAVSAITETVGQVGDFVITSREVQISTAIEKILFQIKPDAGAWTSLNNFSVDSKEFQNAVAAVLLEVVVAIEAESFNVANASDKEIQDAVLKIEKNMAGKAAWSQLEVSALEIKQFVKRKYIAKGFLKFKTSSLGSIITDQEAEAFYDKNRLKFGNIPFATFKDNIKAFLGQQQLEDRLRSWFEVIKRKHKVRNLISG